MTDDVTHRSNRSTGLLRPPPVGRAPHALLLRYGCGLLVAGLALGSWQIGKPAFGSDPFPLFLAAIAIVAWYGCLGPALVTTAIVCVVTVVFAAPAQTSHHVLHHVATGSLLPTTHQFAQFGFYVLVALAVGLPQQLVQRTQSEMRRRLHLGSVLSTNVGEGVCALDGQGRVTFLNPGAERMLGWSEAEVLGRPIHDLIHGCRKRAALLEANQTCPLETVWRSGIPYSNDDDEFQTKEGDGLAVAYSSSPIYVDGTTAGAVLTFRDITDRKQAMAVLENTKERYATLIRTSPDSILVTDVYGYIIMASRRAAELYGYSQPDDMVGISSMELFAPDERVRVARDKRRTMDEGTVRDIEYIGRRRDGSLFPSEVSSSLVVESDGKPEGLVLVTRDRTEQKEAERAARQTEACAALQYAASAVLAESSSLGDAIPKLLQTLCQGANWDVGAFWAENRQEDALRCRFVWHNQKLEIPQFDTLTRQISFVPGAGLPGRVWLAEEPVWITDVVADPEFTRALAASKEGLHAAFAVPVRIEGNVHAVLEFFSREVREPNPELLSMMMNLSNQVGYFIKRRQAEEALEHAAYHDPLTNLANRLLFKGRMDRAILAAWPDSKSLAVLMLDLNKFKQINDTYGHQYGDLILQHTATRLRYTLRDSDTVARLGGDEFAVLLPTTEREGAEIVASKIVEAITQPITADGMALQVGTSIGIALYPDHGEDTNTLMHHADVAMYSVKADGGGLRVYEASQEESFERRREGSA